MRADIQALCDLITQMPDMPAETVQFSTLGLLILNRTLDNLERIADALDQISINTRPPP